MSRSPALAARVELGWVARRHQPGAGAQPAGRAGPSRDLLRLMAFGVVLFTLLAQATTMQPLIRWLRLNTRSEAQDDYEQRHARLMAARAAEKRLYTLHQDGLISTPAWEKLKASVTEQVATLGEAVRQILKDQPAPHIGQSQGGPCACFGRKQRAFVRAYSLFLATKRCGR